MISMLKPDDKDFETYRFKVSDLAALLEVEKNKNIYSQIDKVTESLLRRGLKIPVPEKKRLLKANWISSVDYYYGEGYVELGFSSKLIPFLLDLKERFLKYSLNNILTINSSYAIRIYELLKQYEKIGKRRFKYKELRAILGIEPHEYKLYSDFKRNVILISQRELKEKTDIRFEFKEIKLGRKVDEIEFIILPNKADKLLESESDTPKETNDSGGLLDQLIEMKISKRQANNLINNYAPDVIQRNIELIKKRAAERTIGNVPGYLIDAIKNDYATNTGRDSGPSRLLAEARQCWYKNPGCRARWSTYKDDKTKGCHYCQRFEKQRSQM